MSKIKTPKGLAPLGSVEDPYDYAQGIADKPDVIACGFLKWKDADIWHPMWPDDRVLVILYDATGETGFKVRSFKDLLSYYARSVQTYAKSKYDEAKWFASLCEELFSYPLKEAPYYVKLYGMDDFTYGRAYPTKQMALDVIHFITENPNRNTLINDLKFHFTN